MVASQVPKPQRIELILRQLDTLPTLPAVAARLLQLTSDDSSSIREVIDLVASDPAILFGMLVRKIRTLVGGGEHSPGKSGYYKESHSSR